MRFVLLTCPLMPCWVMKVFRAPVSEFCGYPKSRISAQTRADKMSDKPGRDTSRAPRQPTVQQLVDEHKVVLDVLLADFAEVGGHDVAHLVEELEDHGGVDVLLGDGRQPDVGAFDMEEAGAGDVGHRGSHLLPGVNHVDAEGVDRVAPGTEGARGV